jgi:penicillin-binding protein 2
VQIFEGARYAAAARANQIRRIPVAAPRGRIFDRNGIVLVRSRPSFVCAMIPSDVHDPKATMHELASVLGVHEAVLWKRLLHHHGINYDDFDQVALYEPYGPVVLATDLSNAQIARLAESQDRLPGLDLEAQPVRDYPEHKLGSHFFGYVGEINEDEYRELKGKGYSPSDVIGKDGLEQEYDAYLRGTPGGERIEVNAQGQMVQRLGPIEPKPGDSLQLSIDWRIQKLAEDALRNQLAITGKLRGHPLAGAVVVMDPKDGGVLALASYPNFDPNDFTGGISEKKYAAYLNDPLHPLYDRAIGAATPTGSIFKMITGSGAITSGVIKSCTIRARGTATGTSSATSRRAGSARPISSTRSRRRRMAISISSAIVWATHVYAIGRCSMAWAAHWASIFPANIRATGRPTRGRCASTGCRSSRATRVSSRSAKAGCKRRRCRWRALPRRW